MSWNAVQWRCAAPLWWWPGRVMGRLSATKVRALKEPGRYGDGGTLYLVVAPGGSKSWVQRVLVHGRRRDLGLGGWPVVSLARARERAFANRVLIADGGDPVAAKRKANAPTFREAAERVWEAMRPRWRSEKTVRSWMQQMERHVFPVIGDLRVDRVRRENVLDVLDPLWNTIPAAARRLRGRIRGTLAWARAHGFVDVNVVMDIDGALAPIRRAPQHHRALPYGEVAEAVALVEASDAAVVVKALFRFVVLTACRTHEARLATWAEIDVERREWRIAASRTKTLMEHRVPVTDAAAAALEAVSSLRKDSGLVFPSAVRAGVPVGASALARLLEENGIAAVPHGFRTSFRTWAAEQTDAPHAVAEMALGHRVGSEVERSYARSDLFEKRRQLMERWAEFVTGSCQEGQSSIVTVAGSRETRHTSRALPQQSSDERKN